MNENDIELINRYSRKELTEDEVYIFSVTLCDNEIDRDNERFTKSALDELAELFEGKTGIFDHSMKTVNQNARIFKTWVEADETRKTSIGEQYYRLKAKAYMIRTEDNKSLIDEIEAGIKKEVSVSCSVDEINCSICGENIKMLRCEHIPGKNYAGKLCHRILNSVSDAYEWSFVAVPAQREAGVTKAFSSETNPTAIEKIKSCSSSVELSEKQVGELREYIAFLESFSDDATEYRNTIIRQIQKYALIAMPKVNISNFISGCKDMSIHELKELNKGLKDQAEQFIPPQIQLKPITNLNKADNTAFQI